MIEGLGFGVWGSGVRVERFGLKVWSAEFRVQGVYHLSCCTCARVVWIQGQRPGPLKWLRGAGVPGA